LVSKKFLVVTPDGSAEVEPMDFHFDFFATELNAEVFCLFAEINYHAA